MKQEWKGNESESETVSETNVLNRTITLPPATSDVPRTSNPVPR